MGEFLPSNLLRINVDIDLIVLPNAALVAVIYLAKNIPMLQSFSNTILNAPVTKSGSIIHASTICFLSAMHELICSDFFASLKFLESPRVAHDVQDDF